MLVFPAKATHAHLAGRFYDGNVENLAADFAVRRLALLFCEIDKSLISDGFDVAVTQYAEREAKRADRFGFGNALLDFFVGEGDVGANRAVVNERAAGNGFGSVGDGNFGSPETSVRPIVTDAQFRNLRGGTGDGTLMTFAAGLRVI